MATQQQRRVPQAKNIHDQSESTHGTQTDHPARNLSQQ